MTNRTTTSAFRIGILLLLAAGGFGCAAKPSKVSEPYPTFPSPSGPGGRHFEDQSPIGWRKTPVDPTHFRYSVDRKERNSGKLSGRIDGTAAADERVASLSQLFPATSLAGQTVRVIAQFKQRDVEDWAHMWVSVRGTGGTGLAADRVPLDRVHGDLDWRRLEAEVTVPKDAESFSLGFVLVGPGTVWIDDVEILDMNGRALASPLRNAGFEQGDPSQP